MEAPPIPLITTYGCDMPNITQIMQKLECFAVSSHWSLEEQVADTKHQWNMPVNNY